MPCGCVGLLVRMRATMPSVNAPVRWFCFSTICTRNPGRISLRTGTLIRSPFRVFTAFNQTRIQESAERPPLAQVHHLRLSEFPGGQEGFGRLTDGDSVPLNQMVG